jgi:glutathione S-transferase
MLTLYTFGPYFGMPDASPFCIKALMLLKMSGLEHTVARMEFSKAPKGKAPYLQDGSTIIADSHFIMRHLETAHSIDFSGGYSPEKLATGVAVARMLEEHYYFLSAHVRWLEDDNFAKGPAQFFNAVPAIVRPFIKKIVRGKVRKTLHLQGLGRHTAEERLALAVSDLEAVENILGDNPYMLGARASAVDASVLAFLWAGGTAYFRSPIGDYIRTRPRLVAYIKRLAAEFFPGFQT